MAKTDTRQMLLDSAEQAARTRGFDGFSYKDLAKDVGIRTASIHYHFPTKADLSADLMERYRGKMKAECDRISRQSDQAGARLLGLINTYRAALDEGRMLCLCVALTVSREHLADEVVAQLNLFRAEMIAWLQDVFELGRQDGTISHVGETANEARANLAMLEGAHLAARAAGDITVFDGAVETMRARVRLS